MKNLSFFTTLVSSIVGVILIAGGIVVAQTLPPALPGSPGGCHIYNSDTPPPQGYGTVYDVFDSAKRLLLGVICQSSSGATLNVGVGDSNQIIYEKGWKYVQTGTTGIWQEINLSGPNQFTAGGTLYPWYTGSASANIPPGMIQSGTNYVVAYVCTAQNGQWKCGCRDSTCTQGFWQLQAFAGNGSISGGSSGSTGERVSYTGTFAIMVDPIPEHVKTSGSLAPGAPHEFWWMSNGYENCTLTYGAGGSNPGALTKITSVPTSGSITVPADIRGNASGDFSKATLLCRPTGTSESIEEVAQNGVLVTLTGGTSSNTRAGGAPSSIGSIATGGGEAISWTVDGVKVRGNPGAPTKIALDGRVSVSSSWSAPSQYTACVFRNGTDTGNKNWNIVDKSESRTLAFTHHILENLGRETFDLVCAGPTVQPVITSVQITEIPKQSED